MFARSIFLLVALVLTSPNAFSDTLIKHDRSKKSKQSFNYKGKDRLRDITDASPDPRRLIEVPANAPKLAYPVYRLDDGYYALESYCSDNSRVDGEKLFSNADIFEVKDNGQALVTSRTYVNAKHGVVFNGCSIVSEYQIRYSGPAFSLPFAPQREYMVGDNCHGIKIKDATTMRVNNDFSLFMAKKDKTTFELAAPRRKCGYAGQGHRQIQMERFDDFSGSYDDNINTNSQQNSTSM